MRVLYLSCHSVLEYDELRLFELLGINYFSYGSYIFPNNPADPIRPPLNHTPDEDVYSSIPPQEALTSEFLDKFTHIVVMHRPDWIESNWHVLKGRNVFYRSIGQSAPHVEMKLKLWRDEGLKIIRYSKEEERIPGYAGCDHMAYFYKDPDLYRGYVGTIKQAYTVVQDFKHRGKHVGYQHYLDITKGLPATVFGVKNDNLGELNGGYLSYQDLFTVHQLQRVFIYTGTQPAQYTLSFMEALMTGTPIVALGREKAMSLKIAGDGYEIPNIITNEVNGYYSDNVEYLHDVVESLLNDREKAIRIGSLGREAALSWFSMEKAKNDWSIILS